MNQDDLRSAAKDRLVQVNDIMANLKATQSPLMVKLVTNYVSGGQAAQLLALLVHEAGGTPRHDLMAERMLQHVGAIMHDLNVALGATEEQCVEARKMADTILTSLVVKIK